MCRVFELYPYCAIILNHFANHFSFVGQHFLVEHLAEIMLILTVCPLMKSLSYYDLAQPSIVKVIMTLLDTITWHHMRMKKHITNTQSGHRIIEGHFLFGKKCFMEVLGQFCVLSLEALNKVMIDQFIL